jgi:hypothetical protein
MTEVGIELAKALESEKDSGGYEDEWNRHVNAAVLAAGWADDGGVAGVRDASDQRNKVEIVAASTMFALRSRE